MPSTRTSQIVGSAFGLIYIEANAGGLPPLAAALRIAGLVLFAGLLIALRRYPAPASPPSPAEASPPAFGGRYWAVVTAEAIVAVAGIIVIGNVFAAPSSIIAWITLVVGVHFLALATVMRYTPFGALGSAMAALGIIALILASLGMHRSVPVVAGILPGLLLFAFVAHSITPRSYSDGSASTTR